MPRLIALSRLNTFYFLYFGILGVYIPFFNLYCKDLGFSGFQIGLISAIPPLARLLFPVFWGVYADKSGQRELIFRLVYFFAIVTFSTLLLVKQFIGVVAVLVLYTFFLVPVLPLWEATVLEELSETNQDYGRIRLWGSLGFIFFSLGVGWVLDRASSGMILRFILFLSVLNLWYSRSVSLGSSSVSVLQAINLSWLKDSRLIIFLICCALMQASHGTYYGFFSIFMSQAGHSNIFIGFLWTIGVACEVGVMMCAGGLIRKFGYQRLFPLVFLAAVLRWGLSSLIGEGPVFILIQGLHGLTFALFHVCAVTWIAQWAPPGFKTTAQSLYSSATYGVGGIIGFLLNGLLYDSWGARGLWLLSCGLAIAGFGLSLIFVQKRNRFS